MNKKMQQVMSIFLFNGQAYCIKLTLKIIRQNQLNVKILQEKAWLYDYILFYYNSLNKIIYNIKQNL